MVIPAIPDEEDDGPEIGARVRVYNADQTRDLGYGTYLGEVPVRDIPDGPPPACVAIEPIEVPVELQKALSEMLADFEDHDTPKIKLDSGEIVYGFQCWWHEVDDDDDEASDPSPAMPN